MEVTASDLSLFEEEYVAGRIGCIACKESPVKGKNTLLMIIYNASNSNCNLFFVKYPEERSSSSSETQVTSYNELTVISQQTVSNVILV